MAGAIDLFAGAVPIAGPNLFTVDKNPLREIDQGIEDVIGQKASGLGNEITQLIQALINAILGFGTQFLTGAGGILGDLQQIDTFFTNTLAFLGELNPLSPTFNISAAAGNFAQEILLPTNFIAPLVTDATAGLGLSGFVPIENLAMSEISAIIGTAQEVIDAILATVGWAAGAGTATDVQHYFTDLLAMFDNPALTGGAFNAATAVGNFITTMIAPHNLLAPMNPSTLLVDATHLPSLTSSWGQTIDGSLLRMAITNATLTAAALTAGAIPAGVTLGAAALTAGAIGAGVTIAGSALTSAIAAANVPALPAGWGKTIDGSLLAGSIAGSLINGAITGGTLPASALTAGTIPTGITLAGTQLTGAINSALTMTGTGTPLSTVESNAGTALSTGQQTIDGITNAVNATNLAGQAVSTVQSGLSGFFTNLFNAYNPSTPASTASAGAATSSVASTAANTSTSLSTHTVDISSIQSQLPSFYGGGTGGLSESISFSGGTLPAGFSTISTIATAAAKYNTAATTDAETVSGAWSVADVYAKYLFLRANSAFTSYVYAKLQNNDPSGGAKCEIGCVVAGVKTVFQTFTLPSAGNVVVNTAYSLEAAAYTFTVQGPGLDLSYTDSSHVSQLGSAYRFGGFGTDGYERAQQTFGTSGTYTVPAWAVTGTKFDIVGIGGGGGGNTGAYQGAPATWNGVTLTYGTNIPTSTTTFTVTAGVGGASQSPSTGNAPGANGSASTVAITGYPSSPFSAAGGLGAANTTAYPPGAPNGAPNYTFHNAPYTGSGTAAAGNSGITPGGGAPVSGGAATTGGNGEVWITAIDTTVPGSLGVWAFYDSAAAGPATAYVASLSGESTTSTSYTDLATTTDQVTVNVGSSGMALVNINATVQNLTGGNVSYVSFAASGANTVAADDSRNFLYQAYAAGASGAMGGSFLMTGLAAGATTFKMKYKVNGSTGYFYRRTISVIPL